MQDSSQPVVVVADHICCCSSSQSYQHHHNHFVSRLCVKEVKCSTDVRTITTYIYITSNHTGVGKTRNKTKLNETK